MAKLAKRFCNHIGCGDWAEQEGKCSKHIKEQQQLQDNRRGSAYERGYTGKWTKSSTTFRRNNPFCWGCEAIGRHSLTDVTDHTIPHKGDSKLFWDTSNWQPLCAWHHDKVKQILEQAWESGKIPASELKIDSNTAIRYTKELLGIK